MSRKHPIILFCLACLAVFAGTMAQAESFEFGNYQVISSARVGRTEFEYVMKVTITNKVGSAQGVTAEVFSWSDDTVIVEGSASFGNVSLGAEAVATDTFTIRQNRLVAFNPEDLQWFVSVGSMPLTLTVDEPVSGLMTNGTNVVVSGTVDSAVDGVRVGNIPATLTGTNFTALYALEEGRNTISVLATNEYGGVGVVNVLVSRDTTPPILSIETPTEGDVLGGREVTVTGQINDIVPGTVNPEQASVMVNGLAATILNRSYAISGVLLSPGRNTITALGRDRAGNESRREIVVTFQDPASQKRLVRLAGDEQTGMIGHFLPGPLVVELVDGSGVVQTNQPVQFTVSRNDGTLSAPPDAGRSLTVFTDDKGQAGVLFQLGTRSGVGNNEVTATSAGVAVPVLFGASATGAPPANIAALIPESQSGEVGKPLPLPWTVFVTDAGGNPVGGAAVTFAVTQGDGNFGGAPTVVTNTDNDGRAFALQTLGPVAGVNNNAVVATVAGVTNSAAVFTASGQTPGLVSDTRVVGLVLDNANRPMSNILCRIENTFLATVTDAQGQFVLANVPVGAVRLNVDARDRGYPGEWHSLQFDLVTVAGRDNSLDRPIYMVLVDPDSAAIVGGAQDVTLHLKGVPGSSLTIYAHSLRDANQQPITNRVTWTQVNAERIPMAPPQGSQPILTTAILPSGYRFNPPARLCIPNSGLPPGQILELYGYDHDMGAFVSVGTATVSTDGSQICSNPGFGVVKSGWHPVVPPPPPCTPVCGEKPPDGECYTFETIPPATKCDCPKYKKVNKPGSCNDHDDCTVNDRCQNGACKGDKIEITSVAAKADGKDTLSKCLGDSVTFSATVQQMNCQTLKYEWTFGDGNTSTSAGPSHTYTASGKYTVTVRVSCEQCPAAQKSDTAEVTVVELDKVQYKRNGTWTDVPGAGFTDICNGSGINFRAVAKPAGSTWPDNEPTWGGDASGTGEENTATFASSGARTVTVKCHNQPAKTVNVAVADANAATTITWDAADYSEVDVNDSSTTTEKPFVMEYEACADVAANKWYFITKKITGDVTIVVKYGGSRNPITSPPTNEVEAAEAVTVMKGYYARGSRGSWHTAAASETHERHHYTEWQCSSEHYWPSVETCLEKITVPYHAHATKAAAITALKAAGADTLVTNFKAKARVYWFTLADNASSRPYAAGQLTLNNAIISVQTLATTNGWVVTAGTDTPSAADPCYEAYPAWNPCP